MRLGFGGRYMSTFTRKLLLLGCSTIAMMAARGLVLAQEEAPPEGGQQPLPQVTVTAPKQAPKQVPKQAPKRAAPKVAAPRPAPAPPRPPAVTPEQAQQAANRTVVQQTTTFDQRSDTVILPKVGANTDTKDLTDLEA